MLYIPSFALLNLTSCLPRFSLPEGALTTYDSYPERTLPDGRVSIYFIFEDSNSTQQCVCSLWDGGLLFVLLGQALLIRAQIT